MDNHFASQNSHSDVVTRIVNAGLTLEFMHALGWQGGTVHQVADELIKRDLQDVDIYHALVLLSDLRFETLAAKYGYTGAIRLIESGRVRLGKVIATGDLRDHL